MEVAGSADECPLCHAIQDPRTRVVYADDLAVVLPPLEQRAAVHMIAVPRAHYASVDEMLRFPEVVAALMSAAGAACRITGITDSGFRLIMNSGPATDQTVIHPHVHVIGGEHLAPAPA